MILTVLKQGNPSGGAQQHRGALGRHAVRVENQQSMRV